MNRLIKRYWIKIRIHNQHIRYVCDITGPRTFVHSMSHSLYIDETPTEVKNAKVSISTAFLIEHIIAM